MCSSVSINTGARVLESSVDASSAIHAWITVTLVDIYTINLLFGQISKYNSMIVGVNVTVIAVYAFVSLF